MIPSLLILEDDKRLLESLRREFEDRGYQVSTAASLSEIPNALFTYALVDLRLAGEFGLNALEIILNNSKECRIVILSGYGSITTAVEAIKRGAVDYLIKPARIEEIEAAFRGERTQQEAELKTPTLSQVESEYIDFVLTKNNGNISQTAKDIGLHRQSLQRKLKKFT